MHRRADANSRPDGDRARQRDPCVCACICLRRRALSATFDLPLLLRAAALTRTTRGSTENRRDEDGAKRAIRATCFRPIRFHAWRETGAADILSPLSSPIFTCLSFYLSLYARPCHPSRSSQRRLRCNIYIYIYIVWKIRKLVDVRFGGGLKKKGDRGEE